VTEPMPPEPVVLTPPARFDSNSAGDFEQELLAHIAKGAQLIALDFSHVSYISSAGLRTLLIGAKRLRETGGRVGLCSVSENCYKVLEVSGFVALFPLFPTVAAAFAPSGA
jgi:stage II sporulation protein AA (anti-sigma F factor antagonist)